MSRRTTTAGIQVEQKLDPNNRRVTVSGIQVEQKLDPNYRRVSSSGIQVEQKLDPNYRRVSSSGIQVEWRELLPSDYERTISSIGLQLEWMTNLERRLSGIGLMIESEVLVEVELDSIAETSGKTQLNAFISGDFTGYKVPNTRFTISGSMFTPVNVEGLGDNWGLINGTFYGEANITGMISSGLIHISNSYLMMMTDLNKAFIGIVQTPPPANILKAFLVLDNTVYVNDSSLVGTLLGVGRFTGLAKAGKIIFNMKCYGPTTITGITDEISGVKPILITFNDDNSIEISYSD